VRVNCTLSVKIACNSIIAGGVLIINIFWSLIRIILHVFGYGWLFLKLLIAENAVSA
jgi:hypothetical protein